VRHNFVDYFQGVKRETLDLFGVRVTADGRGLVFPVYGFTGALVGVKIISAVEETDSVKTHVTTRTIPRSNSLIVCCRSNVVVSDVVLDDRVLVLNRKSYLLTSLVVVLHCGVYL